METSRGPAADTNQIALDLDGVLQDDDGYSPRTPVASPVPGPNEALVDLEGDGPQMVVVATSPHADGPAPPAVVAADSGCSSCPSRGASVVENSPNGAARLDPYPDDLPLALLLPGRDAGALEIPPEPALPDCGKGHSRFRARAS